MKQNDVAMIKVVKEIMGRVDIKGKEAIAYVQALQWLESLPSRLSESEKPKLIGDK